MDNGTGFRLAAGTLGRIGHEAAETNTDPNVGLTIWDKLSFFREDAAVMLIVIPLLLLLVVRYLPRKLRTPAVAILSLATWLLLAVQVRAFQVLGRFVSLEMARLALSWAWAQSEVINAYVQPKRLILVLLVMVGMGIGAWTGWRFLKRRRMSILTEDKRIAWNTKGTLTGAALLLGVSLLWLPRVSTTPFHRTLLVSAVRALWDTGEVDTREFLGLSTAELMNSYRDLTHTPLRQRDSRYWAKCQKCNVLIFVFETGAEEFMPRGDSLNDLPNFRRLRQRAFVGSNHYTTYPLTSRALYSMLTSWYPSDTMKADVEQHPDMVLPGFTRNLGALGYQTSTYSPKHFNRDDAMFQMAGFQQQKLATRAEETSADKTSPAPPDWMQDRIGRDIAVLHLMETDLGKCASEGRRFSAMFLPQVGHHPWPNYKGNAAETDPRKRARAILALQDVWLGELIALLDRTHQLDQTLIVVTGDHGVRSREEDPTLDGGMVDEYSFHVPMLLYVPGVLDHTETIPWLTSHIDIAPTLLDLLGIEDGREFEQGLPLWTPALVQRTTFFFAYHMFGADGYYSNGKFYMWSRVSGSVYAKARQHFADADRVPPDSALAAEVTLAVSRMAGLQQVLDARFAKGNFLRTRVFSRGSK